MEGKQKIEQRRLLDEINADIFQRKCCYFFDWFTRGLVGVSLKTGSKLEPSTASSKSLADITNSSEVQTHSISSLATILRSLKLIHSARAPIFFTSFATSIRSAVINEEEFKCRDEEFSEVQDILKAYVADYISYLASLGLEVVDGEPTNLPTQFFVTETASVSTEVLYLRKVFDFGVIIVQIGIHGLYSNINLFQIALPHDDETKDLSGKLFHLECERIKSSMHLLSCKLYCI